MPVARRKIVLLALVALAVAAFFWFDLHLLLTFESIKASQDRVQELYRQQPATVIAGYAALYLLVVTLNLPGAALLSLLAGAVFGVLAGTVLVSFVSSLGATLACLLSRTLLRDLVRRKFPQAAATVDQGLAREGIFYLFSLRLIPAIPFFVINMVMGLTAMRLRTFYWVSQVGMLPGTIVYVNAGSELGRLTSPAGIFSPRLLAAFALLGLLPLAGKRLLALLRSRDAKKGNGPAGPTAAPGGDNDSRKALAQRAQEVQDNCTRCRACTGQCAFLKRYGLPGDIAAAVLAGKAGADPFACSLCTLCHEVCPEQVEPASLFLAMRRRAVAAGQWPERDCRPILAYEKRGNSPLFTWYGLPAGCRSVFFPGCALPGTRPETTWHLYHRLRQEIPSLGMVLDCCSKPSHDLGRQDHFLTLFGEMQQWLREHGISEVLVACPNCWKVFREYGHGLSVRSIWQYLAEKEEETTGEERRGHRQVTIHDPCPMRGQEDVHLAVRKLVRGQGLAVREMRSCGRRTLCCGEGGSVGLHAPELAGHWGELRRQQAGGEPMVTYCAGCAGFLARAGMETLHLGDLLLAPEATLAGTRPVSRAPWTYLNRLRLKRRLRRSLAIARERVRPARRRS